MVALRNPRRERFAELLAHGTPQSEAYRLAGYRSDTGNASTLAGCTEIQGRVDEIRGALQARSTEIIAQEVAKPVITLASLIAEADELQTKAANAGQFGAAVAALKLKAELSGHYVKRMEHVPSARSAAEIEDRIRQLLADVPTASLSAH